MGLNIDSKISVQEISVEQKTMLVISKALLYQSKLIILDEPTAVLNKKETNILFNFIKKQKSKNVSFIYISHHLEEIFEICDKVLILVDGKSNGDHDVKKLNIKKLINLMIGKNINIYKRKNYCQNNNKVFEVNNLTRRGIFENINLDVKQGEILGICGLGSSGLNELMLSIYGLDRKGIGFCKLNGNIIKNNSPLKSINKGIVYLTNDRHEDGLVNFRPLRENISISALKYLSKYFLINKKKESLLADSKIEELNIIPEDKERDIDLFSGGNQQKIIFARLTATKPKLMLLNEPAQGVDVNSKNDIFKIIEDFSTNNISIIIASSEIRELISICDKIFVMYKNKIVYEVEHDQFDLKKIMYTMEQGI
jgi:ABC-type sugar transport system ATPase subunit